MKKLILIFISALSISLAYSQSFELYYEGQVLPQNGEITLTSHADSGLMVLDTLDVKNISSVTSEVKCIRTMIENIEGTITVFAGEFVILHLLILQPSQLQFFLKQPLLNL